MKQKRLKHEKIISALKKHQTGVPALGLARRYGVAKNTIYRWKSKFVGMEVLSARRFQKLDLMTPGGYLSSIRQTA